MGKPIFTIPCLGYFADWLSNPPGIYLAGTGMVIFAILLFLLDLLAKADESDRKAAAKKAEKEKTDAPVP